MLKTFLKYYINYTPHHLGIPQKCPLLNYNPNYYYSTPPSARNFRKPEMQVRKYTMNFSRGRSKTFEVEILEEYTFLNPDSQVDTTQLITFFAMKGNSILFIHWKNNIIASDHQLFQTRKCYVYFRWNAV